MARLGDIVTISPSSWKNDDEQVWLLNLDMVEQKTGNILAFNYVPKEDLNGSIIQFDAENVLYSKLRPNLNKVVLPLKPGYATSEMLPLRPNTCVINREYLATYLRSNSFVAWATSKTTGAKMPRISTKDLLNKDIPLPSLEKQQEIVDVTNGIYKLIILYKRQLTKLDELVKARFFEMFGEEHENPFGFDIVSIGNISEELFAGGDKPTDLVGARDANHLYPVYTTGEINDGLQGYSGKCRVTRPALTISARGTIGFCCIREANFTPAVRLITVVPSSSVDLIYLKHAICSMNFQRSGTSQAQLTVPDFSKVSVKVPPIERQQQFSAFAIQIDKSKSAVQSALERAQLLSDSLMQKYFG